MHTWGVELVWFSWPLLYNRERYGVRCMVVPYPDGIWICVQPSCPLARRGHKPMTSPMGGMVGVGAMAGPPAISPAAAAAATPSSGAAALSGTSVGSDGGPARQPPQAEWFPASLQTFRYLGSPEADTQPAHLLVLLHGRGTPHAAVTSATTMLITSELPC